jgi:hypothetical protein
MIHTGQDVKTLSKSEWSAKLSQKGKDVPHLRISNAKEIPPVCAI